MCHIPIDRLRTEEESPEEDPLEFDEREDRASVADD